MEKLTGDLNTYVEQSIQTGSTVEDCIEFNFDVKVLSVIGKICKTGLLDVKVSVIGIEIQHLRLDLSTGEYCNKVSVGFEEVQYCFYLKGSCLYTKGYVDGWLHPKETWDVKIICF